MKFAGHSLLKTDLSIRRVRSSSPNCHSEIGRITPVLSRLRRLYLIYSDISSFSWNGIGVELFLDLIIPPGV